MFWSNKKIGIIIKNTLNTLKSTARLQCKWQSFKKVFLELQRSIDLNIFTRSEEFEAYLNFPH